MSKKYRPIIKEGTHLARSKNSDGTYRGALLDNKTNQVVGQAEWEEVEEDDDYNYLYEDCSVVEDAESEENVLESLVALAVIISGIKVIEKTSPYIEDVIKKKVIPSFDKTRGWITEKVSKKFNIKKRCDLSKKDNNQLKNIIDETDSEIITESIGVEILNQDSDNSNKYIGSISREEAEQHMLKIKILSASLANEIRILTNKCIDGNDITLEKKLEIQNEMEKLMAVEVIDTIKMLLENKFISDEMTRKIFEEFILGNVIVDDKSIPIKTLIG